MLMRVALLFVSCGCLSTASTIVWPALWQPCQWKIQVVESVDWTINAESLSPIESLENISIYMQNLDIKNLQDVEGMLHQYPFTLKVTVECSTKSAGYKLGRLVSMAGTTPQVTCCTVSLPITGQQMDTCIDIGSQLVETSSLTDNICNETLPSEPAWLAPLPLYNTSVTLQVWVHNDNLQAFIADQSFQLSVTGYDNIATSADGVVSGTTRQPLLYVPGASPVLALTTDDLDTLTISSDEFLSTVTLKMDWGSTTTICMCSHTIDETVLSLVDRFVIIDKTGVHEVQGQYFHQSLKVSSRPLLSLSGCASHVGLSQQHTTQQQYVILVGTCSDEGSIFFANSMEAGNGTLEWNLVQLGGDLCSLYGAVANCDIVDVMVTSLHTGIIYILVDMKTLSGDDLYGFLQYSFDYGNTSSGTWNWLASWKQEVPISGLTWPQPISQLSSEGATTTLTISGISTPPFVSRHIYLWGSRLLHSSDLGRTMFVLPLPNDVVSLDIELLVISRTMWLALLTANQQVWVGDVGSTIVRRVYPSESWNMVHSLNSDDPDDASINNSICSLFFDAQEELQMLLCDASKKTVMRRSVPLAQIMLEMAHAESLMSNGLTSKDFLDDAGSNGLQTPDVCPFSHIAFDLPSDSMYTRKEHYVQQPPVLSCRVPVHTQASLLVYHAVMWDLDQHRQHHLVTYADSFPDHLTRWRHTLDRLEHYNQYLFQNERVASQTHVDLHSYEKVYHKHQNQVNNLPSSIFVGRKDTFQMTISLVKKDADSFVDLDTLQLSVVVTDINLLEVSSVRVLNAQNNIVQYQIKVLEMGHLNQQNEPGDDMYPVGLEIAVVGGGHQCVDKLGVVPQSVYQSTVKLGCIPGQSIMFDWISTKNRIIESLKVPMDCYRKQTDGLCYYFQNAFYPYFMVRDDATGSYWQYHGNYTLKVTGGAQNIRDMMYFSEKEIQRYNQPSQQSGALIWGPPSIGETHDEFPVYNNVDNAVQWFCQPNSPCSNILPDNTPTPEYYFLIEFSNKDLDLDATYCDFTFRFIIRVHGLPLSSTGLGLPLVTATLALFTGYVILYYICRRKNDALLTYTREMMQNITQRRMRIEPENEATCVSTKERWMKRMNNFHDDITEMTETSYEPSVSTNTNFSNISEKVSTTSCTTPLHDVRHTDRQLNHYIHHILRSASEELLQHHSPKTLPPVEEPERQHLHTTVNNQHVRHRLAPQ